MPLGEIAYLIGQSVAFALIALVAGVTHRKPSGAGEAGLADMSAGGPGDDDFGPLRVAVLADSMAAAKVVRERLAAAGIRATLATAVDGRPRVLVFGDDVDRARRFVAQPEGTPNGPDAAGPAAAGPDAAGPDGVTG
jgi:hypothetical protein